MAKSAAAAPAAPPVMSIADQIKALLAQASPEERKQVKADLKVQAKQRDPADTKMLIEIKGKLRAEALRLITEAKITPTDDPLAQVFLAHWPKKYYRLDQQLRRLNSYQPEVTDGSSENCNVWQSGGKGNPKPTWVAKGEENKNYHLEVLVDQ